MYAVFFSNILTAKNLGPVWVCVLIWFKLYNLNTKFKSYKDKLLLFKPHMNSTILTNFYYHVVWITQFKCQIQTTSNHKKTNSNQSPFKPITQTDPKSLHLKILFILNFFIIWFKDKLFDWKWYLHIKKLYMLQILKK